MSFPRYDEYKDSGVEWLGEVPAHWNVKRLRHVATLNPSKSETAELPPDAELSFLPMEAIGEDGSLDLERTRPLTEVTSGYTYFREGDVTIAKITPCFENGKGAIMRGLVGGHGFGTTELIVCRPKAEETSCDYLHWIFVSAPFRKLGEGAMYGAGGQKRVPDDFVREFSTAFPPLPEQTAIAAFLDRETAKIDALVAEQQNLIALLKEKRQALISHAVTKGLNPNAPMKDSGVEWLGEVPAHWEVTPLKHVTASMKAGPFGSALTKDMYVSSGYRVYGQEQVIPGDFSIGDYYITPEDFAALQQYAVASDDVLISCVGTFGKIAIVPSTAEPGIINPRLIRLRTGYLVSPRYLVELMRSEIVFEQFAALSRGGTMDTINISTLSGIVVPIPPREEQPAIEDFVVAESSKIDDLVAEAESTITLLQERRTALISAAVTGKIDVRAQAV